MINYYQNIGLKYHSILYRENLFSTFVLSFRYHCTYRTNSCGNAIANSQGLLHAETGFSYFGARYYDSDLMTGLLSVDPI